MAGGDPDVKRLHEVGCGRVSLLCGFVENSIDENITYFRLASGEEVE